MNFKPHKTASGFMHIYCCNGTCILFELSILYPYEISANTTSLMVTLFVTDAGYLGLYIPGRSPCCLVFVQTVHQSTRCLVSATHNFAVSNYFFTCCCILFSNTWFSNQPKYTCIKPNNLPFSDGGIQPIPSPGKKCLRLFSTK